jgi:O-succinylbenzoate synthase
MVDKMKARLWRHDMKLASPVTSASQVHSTRTHLFLELEIDGVRGLGEVSPQPEPLNGDPGVEDVILELEHYTLRQFIEVAQREGEAPAWARVTHFAGSRPASYAASALLEMALLDASLRSRQSTIEDQWPARFDTPVQATVSLLDDNPWASLAGAAQVRAKISANPVPEEKWEQLASMNLPVLLDFNCSGGTVEDVVATLNVALCHVNVAAVEQPFAPGNIVEHARLAALIDVAVSLDEGVRHRRDLEQIVRYRAARLVCIKPARVGGYAQARTMIERAQHLGLGVYLGGFFESPVARRANRALARHYLERPSDVAHSNLYTGNVVSPDSWGCGFLPGADLESSKTLVNRHW